MIVEMVGVNRGYFEIERTFNGEKFISRFVQIETQDNEGILKIYKIYLPNNEELIKVCKELQPLKKVRLVIDIIPKKNDLFLKLIKIIN